MIEAVHAHTWLLDVPLAMVLIGLTALGVRRDIAKYLQTSSKLKAWLRR